MPTFGDPSIQPRIDQILAHAGALQTQASEGVISGDLAATKAASAELGEMLGSLTSRALIFEWLATKLANGDQGVLDAIGGVVVNAPLPGD
jgi:hypothetical protein